METKTPVIYTMYVGIIFSRLALGDLISLLSCLESGLKRINTRCKYLSHYDLLLFLSNVFDMENTLQNTEKSLLVNSV
jgi:hypothetical protein